MQSYLLDKGGELRWPCEPHSNLSHLPLDDQAGRTDYAVAHLGWIEVRRHQRYFYLRCRAGKFTSIQLGTLYFILEREPSLAIALDYFTRGWNHVLLRNRHVVIRLISSLLATDTVLDVPAPQRMLSYKRAGRTSRFFGRDRVAQEIASEETDLAGVAARFEDTFKNRWLFFELDRERGDTILRNMGGAQYTPFNLSWMNNPIGQSASDYAGDEYGCWVASLHRDVNDSGVALFDDVDAIVDFSGLGQARLRYDRATVPITLKTGQQLIVSFTESNAFIDLRAPARVGANRLVYSQPNT